MTLDFRLILRTETAEAKAELEATVRGIKGVTVATEQSATKSRAAKTAIDAEAAARQHASQANRTYATTAGQAAGATGDLVAQFNDIGVMLAAGQNPLQLAIQQGSQITQRFGNAGAAGAANMLKTAFIQMLNPMNLVFIAGLAGGAAMIEWLTGAGVEARSFEDAINDLVGQADDYVSAIERARLSTAELRGEFGDTSVEIRTLLRDMAELELRETQRAARSASQDLQSQIGIFDGPEFGVGNQKNLADLFDLSVWSRDARKEINSVLDAFQDLDNAGTLDAQIAAAEALKERFQEAAMASGEISEAEDAVLAPLNEMILTLTRVRSEQAGTTEEIGRTKAEATNLNTIAANIARTIASADGSRLQAAFAAAFPTASALLAIAQDVVATIGGAAALQAAASGENYDASAARTGLAGPDGVRAAQFKGGRFTAPVTGAGLRAVRIPSGGGGGGAARDEADALQELIDSLNGEIDALRVQDPIQQEMLKHREALTGATEAERKKVEELIATRERETLLIEGTKARSEFFEDLGTNALEALIVKGESFNDVLKNIAQSLIQAALQATLFGQGPFGSIFGGKSILSGLFGGGGGIGSLLGGGDLFGNIGGFAAGGMIHGPGTGTSDDVLTRTSNGEFIVNARATARNRHLLEAINAGGRINGYAEGGYVGSDSRRAPARGGRDLPAQIYMDLRGSNGDQAIEEKVRRGAAQVVAMYDREGLPVSIQRVTSDQKRRG